MKPMHKVIKQKDFLTCLQLEVSNLSLQQRKTKQNDKIHRITPENETNYLKTTKEMENSKEISEKYKIKRIGQTLGRNWDWTTGVVHWRKHSRFDSIDNLSQIIFFRKFKERERKRERKS